MDRNRLSRESLPRIIPAGVDVSPDVLPGHFRLRKMGGRDQEPSLLAGDVQVPEHLRAHLFRGSERHGGLGSNRPVEGEPVPVFPMNLPEVHALRLLTLSSRNSAISSSDIMSLPHCQVKNSFLYCWPVYPRMALEADMAWCTDGNINTFLLMVFCTWLEYGSIGDCMYGYRNNRLYFYGHTSFSYLYCRCDG